jgi:DNA-binding response OmpR family regulator
MTNSTRNWSVSALLVGEYESDRALLQGIFGEAGWNLWEAPDRPRALACLRRHPVQVVICDKEGPGWHWKKVLRDLRRLALPPQLIVTSRIADDSLWAEVLNIGAYDVLAQPFHREEVERVVAAAHRHFEGARRAPQVAAAGAA